MRADREERSDWSTFGSAELIVRERDPWRPKSSWSKLKDCYRVVEYCWDRDFGGASEGRIHEGQGEVEGEEGQRH